MAKRHFSGQGLQSSGKRIVAPETRSESSNQKQPIFSLSNLQKGFGIEECQRDDQAAFAKRLCKLSEMTWQLIQESPRDGLGCEKINQNSLKVPVPAFITEDVNILAFRVTQSFRMLGYKDEEIFHVLWLDPNLKCYAH